MDSLGPGPDDCRGHTGIAEEGEMQRVELRQELFRSDLSPLALDSASPWEGRFPTVGLTSRPGVSWSGPQVDLCASLSQKDGCTHCWGQAGSQAIGEVTTWRCWPHVCVCMQPPACDLRVAGGSTVPQSNGQRPFYHSVVVKSQTLPVLSPGSRKEGKGSLDSWDFIF